MAKAKAAGSFLGGLTNNPGVIIIVVIAIALFLFRDRISSAFASVGESFGNINIQLPEFPSITLPEFPTFELPSLPPIFGGGEPDVEPPFEGFDPDEPRIISPCECGSTVVQDASGRVTTTCLACQGEVPLPGDPAFIGPLQPEPSPPDIFQPSPFPIDVQDPEAGGEFGGGGPSFEGGFIFENPIDTLSEVLAAFPQLTASQAADFLAEFSGILPSELPFIDPDITNITAPSGEMAGSVTPEDLASEEQRAACVSCELFGLNCPLCNGE